jgi:calcineurin-like phosphoesterase family protein
MSTRRSWGWFHGVTATALGVAVLCSRLESAQSVTVVAYGDTRFTDPSNTTATSPAARHALVARIADERPDAILISGDLPWHGGTVADYDVFRAETEVWRARHLRILPALGNHEFSQCGPGDCLEHWWTTFPELRGKRWYAAEAGPDVRILALDTMSPLLPASEQRDWLEHEVNTLPKSVQFVLITLHHPPVADVQTRLRVDHNPRPNEIALREYLRDVARTSRARFVVVAGHIHNYERFLRDDVVYLVSGGGGAVPYEVERTEDDLYQTTDFPNYHYLKLTVGSGRLDGKMYRLTDPSAAAAEFTLKDTFELRSRRVGSVAVHP